MIRLESKTVAVNDSRSNMYLTMDSNIDVTPTTTIDYMMNRIAGQGQIANLVFNCHGQPAQLHSELTARWLTFLNPTPFVA